MASRRSSLDSDDSDVVVVGETDAPPPVYGLVDRSSSYPESLRTLQIGDVPCAKLPLRAPSSQAPLDTSRSAKPVALALSLDARQLARIRQVWESNARPETVVANVDAKDEIQSRAFKSLQGSSWLQSGVVNSYLQLLQNARSPGKHPRIQSFNTFFFSKLCGAHISTLLSEGFDHLRHIDFMAVRRCESTLSCSICH